KSAATTSVPARVRAAACHRARSSRSRRTAPSWDRPETTCRWQSGAGTAPSPRARSSCSSARVARKAKRGHGPFSALEEFFYFVEPALGARVVARRVLLADRFELL